jgi:hypothetical protein
LSDLKLDGCPNYGFTKLLWDFKIKHATIQFFKTYQPNFFWLLFVGQV